MASMKMTGYTRSRGRLAHSAMSATTLSVIREIVSLLTFAPYTSAKCATISPVVSPLAVSDNTIWSIPVSRRCRLRTICGVNEASVSRGTSICTGPISVNTVLERVPFLELPPSRPAGSCLSYPRCSLISASKAVSSTFLVNWFSSPLGPTRATPCSLA